MPNKHAIVKWENKDRESGGVRVLRPTDLQGWLQVEGVPSPLSQGGEKITSYKNCSAHEEKPSPLLGEGTTMLVPFQGDSQRCSCHTPDEPHCTSLGGNFL